MTTKWIPVVFALGLVSLLAGCKTLSPAMDDPNTLYVGISPDYPPIIFKQSSEVVGLEPDLARAMGKALNRPVKFVEVAWPDQIENLLDDRFDVIMSGMTVTEARKVRINFCEPYMNVGQMALIRRTDAEKYSTPEKIFSANINIGVQRGGTSDALAKQKCTEAIGISYVEPRDVLFYLTNRKIDAYLHDGPVLIWLASENEGDLIVIKPPFTNESLAWGVRKNDPGLQKAINDVLARWKQDGTLSTIIRRWLPAAP